MITTCSLSDAKKHEADLKILIVRNVKGRVPAGFLHMPELSPPTDLYHWAMANKTNPDWFTTYEKEFIQYMNTLPGMKMGLEKVKKMSKEKNVLLCCYCPSPEQCHRKLIAEKLKEMDCEVIIN